MNTYSSLGKMCSDKKHLIFFSSLYWVFLDQRNRICTKKSLCPVCCQHTVTHGIEIQKWEISVFAWYVNRSHCKISHRPSSCWKSSGLHCKISHLPSSCWKSSGMHCHLWSIWTIWIKLFASTLLFLVSILLSEDLWTVLATPVTWPACKYDRM